MNVLLTSVGRRSYLVKYFQDELGSAGYVVAANMYADTPGMLVADIAVKVPAATNPNYVDSIFDICVQHNIGLICSLHDLDVLVLSEHQQRFADIGVKTTFPSYEWAKVTLDKYECFKALMNHSLPCVSTFLSLEEARGAVKSGQCNYPLLVKDRFGFGSSGVQACNNEEELSLVLELQSLRLKRQAYSPCRMLADHEYKESSLVIQPKISGAEVRLVVCNNLDREFAAHFCCKVHQMRSGESDVATSVDRGEFQNLARQLSKVIGHQGYLGVDLLDDNGVFKIIDVNPRFSGDYPFHHMAGANVPRAMLAWAKGDTASESCFYHAVGVRGYKDIEPKLIADG